MGQQLFDWSSEQIKHLRISLTSVSEKRFLELGQRYRFGNQKNTPSNLGEVDGFPNWFYVTKSEDIQGPEIRWQDGIWNPSTVLRGGEPQIPFVICSSSRHKSGSLETPWEDIVKPDDGYAIYYGDNKNPEVKNPESVRGNKIMLEAFRLQHSESKEVRATAPPIFITQTVGKDGPGGGYRILEGIGVITKVDVILQRNPQESKAFQNLRFEIAILDLKKDKDCIDVDWINARRNSSSSSIEKDLAPEIWKRFINEGISSINELRRSVLRSLVVPNQDQLPPPGSELEKILDATYRHFENSKHDFESIAARVVERIFSDQGFSYRTGWITPKSGDGGYDFVGRVDYDPQGLFSSSRQIVLGQAKCEKPSSGTDGVGISRLVARLHRGWYGAFVTTSFFRAAVQKEIASDHYPLLMVPGGRVAMIIKDELDQTRLSLGEYFDQLVRQSVQSGVGVADIESKLLYAEAFNPEPIEP